MTHLETQAQILRVYADAVRRVFEPTLAQKNAQSEAVGLLLSLADATAQCAENIARTEAELTALSQMLGVAQSAPKLRLIKGGSADAGCL